MKFHDAISSAGILMFLILSFLFSCSQPSRQGLADTTFDLRPIEKAILYEKESFYYTDFSDYSKKDASLPIGVFDSGTGGLTVLDALVNFDQFTNDTHEAGADNLPDFTGEKFYYLADQANMPYGIYSSENKTDLLVEHIVKDAQFLLSNKFYPKAQSEEPRTGKRPIKALVIACNTATAYGKEVIEEFIDKTGIDLKVIGVIDAGVRGTLQQFEKNESGTIGVMATVGTIASKGYENTIIRMKKELGYTGNIEVINQGGYGIAEAVDEVPEFINSSLDEPREGYRGPSLDNPDYLIEKTLMQVYDFEFDHNQMLCDTKNTDDCQILQLNSADNYVRYHLVTMMEKLRKAESPEPLKSIVLGCTHYPYLTETIEEFLGYLYDYQVDDEYVYRHLMAEQISLIDPSINVAHELYVYLKEQNMFNPKGSISDSEFFISVPNMSNSEVITDEYGKFPYEYKYGREAGEVQEYVKVVPFDRSNVSAETIDRLKGAIPNTFSLIQALNN